jgi:MYXO-CTERM domain-containing protein
MRWRVTGETWAPWTQLEPISLVALNACDIQVQLRDQAGNMSQEQHPRLCEPEGEEVGFTFEAHQTGQAEVQAYGCQQTTLTFHAWTGLLALGLFFRRRRRMTGQV